VAKQPELPVPHSAYLHMNLWGMQARGDRDHTLQQDVVVQVVVHAPLLCLPVVHAAVARGHEEAVQCLLGEHVVHLLHDQDLQGARGIGA